MAKTALITGGSRGIGAQTVRQFARAGYQTAFCYVQNEPCARTLSHETGALALRADVADRAQVQSMVDAVLARFGRIDVLVNNAGVARQQLFTDTTPQQWQRMLDVNVTGMFHTTQLTLPSMLHHHRGSIINLSSIWGISGASCEVAYSTAKAAVIGFTKALAQELGPSNVRVNCVAPGVIDTDMNGQLDEDTVNDLKEQTPLCRIGRPEDVANTILFLASEQAAFITGQVISPNGGFVV